MLIKLITLSVTVVFDIVLIKLLVRLFIHAIRLLLLIKIVVVEVVYVMLVLNRGQSLGSSHCEHLVFSFKHFDRLFKFLDAVLLKFELFLGL